MNAEVATASAGRYRLSLRHCCRDRWPCKKGIVYLVSLASCSCPIHFLRAASIVTNCNTFYCSDAHRTLLIERSRNNSRDVMYCRHLIQWQRPLEDLGLDGSIILKQMFKEQDGVDWIDLVHDMAGGRQMCLYWPFGFHKMRENFRFDWSTGIFARTLLHVVIYFS